MAPGSIRNAVLLAAIALTAVTSASAQAGVGFAMVGVASGQSARVNALNAGSSSSTPESSCAVTMQFLDMQGQVLKQTVVTLQAGKGASLDVSREQLPGTDLRSEIRAVLLFGYSGGAAPGPEVLQQFDCNIVPSIEVFDNTTGRTSFILTDAKPLPATDIRNLIRNGRPR